MLAQILHDLYVPRELLDGLPEDQKQLLFCKMREEQVRRYHEREEDEEQYIPIRTTSTSKKKKHVTFRLGADGNEWCWIMGEPEISSKISDEQSNSDNADIDNIESDSQDQLRIVADINHTHTTNPGSYFKVHRNERKQIEEISNNIQEARRIFERLESDTRRLVLNKENEILQQQRTQGFNQVLVNDDLDELFYREIKERARKADLERREIARRARDNFRRNSLQLNVCFDTDHHTTIFLQPPSLQTTNTINRNQSNEKKIHIELVGQNPSSSPEPLVNDKLKLTKEEQPSPFPIIEYPRSRPLLPLTREDIRQWFCLSEIPYATFRSPAGEIYPWFHGIITRSYCEQLLNSKPVGTYLIRVNEKIFGYALSYRASDHCRHLLIEVISSLKRDTDRKQDQHVYRFLGGAQHEIFTHLSQLIEKYSNTPIRSNSTDVLRYPCSQIDIQNPDYADLFIENRNDKQYESLYISLEAMSLPQTFTHL